MIHFFSFSKQVSRCKKQQHRISYYIKIKNQQSKINDDKAIISSKKLMSKST